jgi:hypothetical protein
MNNARTYGFPVCEDCNVDGNRGKDSTYKLGLPLSLQRWVERAEIHQWPARVGSAHGRALVEKLSIT